jgi:methylase of polypeptide subunit release factors
MILKETYSDLDFDTIPIDSFWNIGDEKENKMHRIHAYPAKFPAFITTKALEFAKKNDVEVSVIADIFCGCGTTAYEAMRNGIDFWGCDINPVATLIAEAKSKIYDPKKLHAYFDAIVKLQHDSISEEIDNERIRYWFKEDNISELSKLKISIDLTLPVNSFYKKFFLCAFSNILKPTSMWLTKSIKPQFDPNKSPANVMLAFKSQYEFMYKSNAETVCKKRPSIRIENINFLNKKTSSTFADLVVTSPPYVTSYEYADLHQLSSLWLGFADDYKKFRMGSIGSLYHNSDYQKDYSMLNKTGQHIISELTNTDKNKAKSAAKYFVDMQRCVKHTFDLLNADGMALFVIGNTEYKSVKIDNAKHLVESLFSSGFSNIDVTRRKISRKILTPYRDIKGKFTTDSNSRKVYSEEFIITGRKHETT